MVRSIDFARLGLVAAVLAGPLIAHAGPGTPEIELDAPVMGDAASAQTDVAAAFDGTNYLLVWHDERRFIGIWGARVTPDGTVLDPVGFPIAHAGGVPSVAFDGTHFVVVYAASETTPTPNGSDIWAVRVDRDGHVVDPGAHPILQTAGDQLSPVVASDGKATTLVVWYDNRDPETAADIWGLRLDDCGQPLDADGGFPIAVLEDDQALPSVAYSPGPDAFLTIWKDLRGVGVNATFGARVTPDGEVLDADGGIPIIADASHFGVVTGGPDGFLVAYHDHTDDTATQAAARRVSGDGVVLDPEGIPLTAAPDRVQTLPPSVGVSGDGTYLVAYHDAEYGLHAQRIDSSGAVLDTTPLTPFDEPSVFRAAIAGSADAFVLAGSIGNGGYWSADVFLRRWTSSGDELDAEPIPVTQSANLSSEVASAFDGTNHLVVWTDHRSSGDSGVRAARLAPDGTVLDSPPLILSDGSLDPRFCDVAYDGAGTYLVAWREGEAAQEIRYARVSTDGVVSDAGGTVLGTVPTDDRSDGVRVQSAGGNFLVAWSVVTLDTTFLYAAAVSPNGTPLGSATELAPDLVSMELATDGSQYLLVYTEYVDGYQLSAIRLDEQGAAVGSKTVLAPSDPEIRIVAGVSYGDGVFLTSIRQDDTAGQALRSYRVSPDGTSLDANGVTLVDDAGDITGGAIAFDGTRFVVVWRGPSLDPIGREIRAKGVSSDGTPETGDVRVGHSISNHFAVPWLLRLTPGNDGNLLLTYASVREDDGTGAERARARFIEAPFEEFVVATPDYTATSCGSGGASAAGGDGPGGSPADGSGGTTESGGLGGSDDVNGPGASSNDDSGCGCRVGSSSAPTHIAALLALLAAAFRRRPKRRP